MANSDKNIVIIPNRNAAGQPNIRLTGNANVTTIMRVADDNSVSFENLTGQMFSIANNVTSGSIFSVNDISGIPSINVDASGNISLAHFGGNVGVGVASPTSRLHVSGNVRIVNGSTQSGILFPDGSFQITSAVTGSGNTIAGFSASNVSVSNTSTNSTFYPTFVEALSGNVGIRASSILTYNPSAGRLSIGSSPTTAILDVNGPINARATSSEGGEIVVLNPDNGSVGAVLDVGSADNPRLFSTRNNMNMQIGQLAGTGGLITMHTAGSERARIDSLGRVGIGTTSPATRLHVASSDGVSIARVAGTSYAIRMVSAAGIGGYVESTDSTESTYQPLVLGGSQIILTTFGGEKARLTDAGLFGIGTNAPAATLHVSGTLDEIARFNSSSTNPYISLYRQGDCAGYLYSPGGTHLELSAENRPLVLQTTVANEVRIATNSTERLRITGSGLVGIGTSSPSQALHVVGTALASSEMQTVTFRNSSDNLVYWSANDFVLRGAAPTIFFRDTVDRSAMIHCNANLLYFLGGVADTTTWTQVNGQWPFYLNLTNNDGVLGGNFYAVGEVTAYWSDQRLKENIRPINNALSKLSRINGVYYRPNELARSSGFAEDREQVGVLSQDVEKVLPEIIRRAPFDVEYDRDDPTKLKSKSGQDYMTVQYERLTPLLVEAVKELAAIVDEQRLKIVDLEKTITAG